MKPEYNYELIKDYLDGLLDKETSGKIAQLIKEDENARNIARGILILENEFDADGLERYLNKKLNDHQKAINNQTSGFKWLGIAAAVILLAISSVVFYQYIKTDINDLVTAELSVPYPAPVSLRAGDSATSMSRAAKAYATGNYPEASSIFEELAGPEAIFFDGLSQLYMGNFKQSIVLFNNVELQDSRFEEQGRWFLALAYVKAGRSKEAADVLQVIANNLSHYKNKEAGSLLKYLEN